jgi:hypothetical protein
VFEQYRLIPRKYKIAAGIIVVAAFWALTNLTFVSRSSDLPLEVMIQGQGLSIENVGDLPIVIKEVGVNNLPECKPKQYTD